MAAITYDHATVQYPGAERPSVNALNLDIADGEFLVLVGPSGCGKSTSLRALAGLEAVERGHDPDRREGRHAPGAQGPGHRDGVPELRAVPAHDGRGQHGLRAEDRRHEEGRDPQAGGGGREDPRPGAVPRPQAEGAVGWAAAAGGDGPGDRAQPAGVPDGRAAVQPRRQAAGADPHPDRRAAAPAGHHHRLRHPRPGRGHDDGRPGVRAQGRLPDAGRHAAQPLRPAGERVRGRVHRLARR